MKTIKYLLSLTKAARFSLYFGIVISIVGTLVSLLLPLYLMEILQVLENQWNARMVGFAILLLLVWVALNVGASYALKYAGLKAVTTLRSTIWSKLLALPTTYYNQQLSGELVSRVTSDTERVKEFVTYKIVSFITGVITVIGALIALLILDASLTIILLCSIPLVGLFMIPIGRIFYQTSKFEQEQQAKLTSFLQENISEIRLVKAYNAQGKALKEGNQTFDYLFKNGLKRAMSESILGPMMSIIFLGSLVVLIGVGAVRISTGALSVGAMLAYCIYVIQLIAPIITLGTFFMEFQKVKGASERILEILSEPEELLNEGKELKEIKSLAFHNLYFSYGEQAILKSLNFEVKKGEVIAFVGPSGVGKSTIFALIEQFILPQVGEILVNGVPRSSYRLSDYRNLISYVPQDTPILHGSIKDNIAYGLGEVPDEAIYEVCHLANLDEVIQRFPEGIHSDLSERGRNLSGGEKQRIAIARSFLRKSNVLLLDEATASLDTKSESWIQESIFAHKDDKMTMIIAHRLRTVVEADRIIVVEEGEISGSGTHQELLLHHAFYRDLVHKQFIEK